MLKAAADSELSRMFLYTYHNLGQVRHTADPSRYHVDGSGDLGGMMPPLIDAVLIDAADSMAEELSNMSLGKDAMGDKELYSPTSSAYDCEERISLSDGRSGEEDYDYTNDDDSVWQRQLTGMEQGTRGVDSGMDSASTARASRQWPLAGFHWRTIGSSPYTSSMSPANQSVTYYNDGEF